MEEISYLVTIRIKQILYDRRLMQKDFAKLMGKSNEEICKWLKGDHNFTIKTISKIEKALNEKLISVNFK